MNLSLTPELEQFVHTQVASGKYSSFEEVVLAALQSLAERERIYKGRFEELQREIELGVEASLRGEVVDSKTVFSQLQQKLQQRREQAC
ncbi:type II toxin-antitoxin system ParD family antitoxin [Scytonema sp. NUACC26]|uniref:type II toxin-antitoxin system ParD family antitoxin n=1 Tax=Scytonema sp. NUACC26 TaxID=3140176 RepID=UPI0034DC739B